MSALVQEQRDAWEVQCPVHEMPYVRPRYSRNQVDKAGEAVARAPIESDEFKAAIPVLFNWREAHAYPQNSLYVTLHRRALRISPEAIVSQRLKRRPSILMKLMKNEKMELSQMQDIAGCRAVMPTAAMVDQLMDVYLDEPIRSELARTTNYINAPRMTGYRGIHLLYRFNGRADKAPWNNLRIEVQVRTALQHSWATAVEAVDLFTKQNLKQERGQPRWHVFFAVVAAINALQEGTQPVPKLELDLARLSALLRTLNDKLHAIERLESFRALSSKIIEDATTYWYLIVTNPERGTVHVETFSKSELAKAQERYRELEGQIDHDDKPVLVSADSVISLKKAYPAYFADTMAFVQNVRGVLAGVGI